MWNYLWNNMCIRWLMNWSGRNLVMKLGRNCLIGRPRKKWHTYVVGNRFRLKINGIYRGADKFLSRTGRKQANVSVRMAWISYGVLPFREINLMTARVSMLLKSCASLTYFRACVLPGRAKNLPPHQYRGIRKPMSIGQLKFWSRILFCKGWWWWV